MENKERSAYPIPEGSTSIGLTKREYFAGLAMQGILSAQAGDRKMVKIQAEYYAKEYPNDTMMTAIAKESALMADALLKELDKQR